MKKFVLLMVVSMLAFSSNAQTNSKYLAGAVPEKDGRVYFSKIIEAGKLSKDEIFRVVSDWAKLKFVQIDGFRRQLNIDSTQQSIFGLGDDVLIFQNTFFSLDRAHLLYDFKLICSNGSCQVDISRIMYLYPNSRGDAFDLFRGEEMINDESAIRKGKLIRKISKFRINTIDYVDDIANQIESLLGKAALKKG